MTEKKRTQYNSTLPARTTPLTRGAPPKTRRVPKRFGKRRNPAYCAWIRTLDCEACEDGWPWFIRSPGALDCAGRVECAHVKSRGAGGDDVGNTVPLCRAHHRQQHDMGIKSFQRAYDLDLAAIAAELAARFPGGATTRGGGNDHE